MPILHDLQAWLDDAARFRADAGVEPDVSPPWPSMAEKAITALGAPAVGKSTLLATLLAPTASPFRPSPVSLAYRDAAAYLREPQRHRPPCLPVEDLQALAAGGEAARGRLEALFGLSASEAWGIAAGEGGATDKSVLAALPRQGRQCRLLVLRAEAALSRGELEAVRLLHAEGVPPSLVVINVRGEMPALEREEVRRFVARTLEQAGCRATVVIADLSRANPARADAALVDALAAFLCDDPAVGQARSALERVGLGAPKALQLSLEETVAALATAKQAAGPLREALARLEAERAEVTRAAAHDRGALEAGREAARARLERAAAGPAPASRAEAQARVAAIAAVAGEPPPSAPAEAPLQEFGPAAGLAAGAILVGLAWSWWPALALLAAAGMVRWSAVQARHHALLGVVEGARTRAQGVLDARTAAEVEALRGRTDALLAALDGSVATAREALAAQLAMESRLESERRRLEGLLEARQRLVVKLTRLLEGGPRMER